MTSIAPQVPRLSKRVAVPLLAMVFAVTGAPVGNLLVDQAAAKKASPGGGAGPGPAVPKGGPKGSDGGGTLSIYGRKVRR